MPEPPQSNVDNDSLLAQDAPSRLFKKWRDATAVEGGSSEEEEKKFQELQQEVARLKALVSQYEEAASGQRDIPPKAATGLNDRNDAEFDDVDD